ncbi:TPM domain-containing protein [Arcanobacterium hippocoleae]|uniref:TPM domain-containing protein n=1 Tax=Arcanobacterium hippocoleae TaxID=149017 RepID=UPI003342C750
MTRRLSRIFTGVAALSTLFFTSLPAFAEEPFALSSNFIDSAKAVKDDSALLAKITEVPGADLWVVLVKDFSGMDAQDWVKQTFNLTGLQKYDGLVAISTTTRELGFYAHKKKESPRKS